MKPKNHLETFRKRKTEAKTEWIQNNPEGKFKSRCEMGVARSCPEVGCDRAKILANATQNWPNRTGVPLGTARPCHAASFCPVARHVAASAACGGFRGSAVLRMFDPWDFHATLFRSLTSCLGTPFS